jgi:protein arginine kinase
MGSSDYGAAKPPKSTRMTDEFDPWLDAVMRQAIAPAWLVGDSPHSDVAVSSRARIMRNLAGFSFPHKASRPELEAVEREVRSALADDGFSPVENLPEVQRAVLVGSRLISPDFDPNAPGRVLLLSEDRTVAIMVNEEDHLRIQAVTAGYSVESAASAASAAEQRLGKRLSLARDAEFGFLSSSISNAGSGHRFGVMLHLGALAATGKANAAVKEVDDAGFEVRGLLGERSPGLAGFVQVSTTGNDTEELFARLDVLINQEREARSALHEQKLRDGVESAQGRIEAQEGIDMETATRAIGWLRLGALRGIVEHHPRRLDALLTLILFGSADDPPTNRRRSRLFRRSLGLTSLGGET